MTAHTENTTQTKYDNGEPTGLNPTLNEPISADGTPILGQLYKVPARNGRAVRLIKGQVLRIINTHGSQVCDTWAFNTRDMTEFMSMEHVRAWIDRIIPMPGDALVSNQRRAILTMVSDTQSTELKPTGGESCRFVGRSPRCRHTCCAHVLIQSSAF